MEKNQVNFTDENGQLIPLEEIQKAIEEIYNEAKEHIENHENNENNENNEDNCDGSILDTLTDPELQINGENTINTLNFLERSLYLCDEIKLEHAIAFADAIRFWNKVDELDEIPIEDRIPIKIYIDSPGGDLDATFSIIDSIALSKTPIWTITIGCGCSGAFFIGISGHRRFGYPHSSYLFHEGSAQSGGDAHKYLQGVKFYEKKLSMLRKITLKYTKLTEEDYKKHRKDDLWLTAEEALRYGVIDEISNQII